MSEFESDEDEEAAVASKIDDDRLKGIKEILFSVYRVKTGENKLCIAEYITALEEMAANERNQTFAQAMFE